MNKDKRNNIQLLGTLNNSDESGIIANANQVYDANEDKSTQDVSKEHTERIKTLETKESSMQTTLENITKTGEASAASNVTYNHNDSQLDATNVQQAIDEVYSKGNTNRENDKTELEKSINDNKAAVDSSIQDVYKKSNYNDGDNIIDFNTINIIKDNPMWLFLLVDANDKFIYGITRKDGQPHWGIGIPKVVKDYVDKQINDILGTNNITETIDSLKEVEKFLADFKNSDTLKALLDTKANKTDVDTSITNINADIADKYKKSNYNDGDNIIDFNTINLVTDNPRYVVALTDAENRLIIGINKQDGQPHYGNGVPLQIKNYINELLDKTLNPDDTTTDIDTFKEVINFLKGFKNSDNLKSLLDNKTSKSEVKEVENKADNYYKKSNPNDSKGNVVETNSIVSIYDNPRYLKLLVDNTYKMLEAIGIDGVRKFFSGIDVQSTKLRVVDSPRYIFLLTDNDNKIVFAIKSNGDIYPNNKEDITELATKINNNEHTISELNTSVQKAVDDINAIKNNQDKKEDTVYSVFKGQEKYLMAACDYSNYSGHINKDFQLEIITDTHGYPSAISDGVNASDNFKTIDAIIHCGDIANGKFGGEEEHLRKRMAMLAKSKKPWFIVLGNHDVGQDGDIISSSTPSQEYDMYIKPMIDGGVLKVGEYVEGKNYYYHDFVDKHFRNNIRLIVPYVYDSPLDLKDNTYWEAVDYNASYPKAEDKKEYVYDANNPIYINFGNWTANSFKLKKTVTLNFKESLWAVKEADMTIPHLKITRCWLYIGEEQSKWLANVMNSTPEGYGIIIGLHYPFSPYCTNQKNMKFATPFDLPVWGSYPLKTDILYDIVNAYNNRAVLNENVVHKNAQFNTKVDNDGSKYDYKLNADFTSAKGKVYGFVGGHVHQDMIYKYGNFYDITPICGCSWPTKTTDHGADSYNDISYEKESGDISRETSITVTSWREGRIGLAKIGINVTIYGDKRDIEIIDTTKIE